MDDIYTVAYQLHDMLFKSKQYLDVKAKEKVMEEDNDLQKIFVQYKQAQENYMLDKSQENLKVIQKIKITIDTHPKVIEYQKCFKEYQILLGKITDIAYKDLLDEQDLFKKIRAL